MKNSEKAKMAPMVLFVPIGSPLMNLLSSGRILHEPTFKILARPRIDVKTDVMKATENRMESLQSNLLKMSS